jgi:hypothetical protein
VDGPTRRGAQHIDFRHYLTPHPFRFVGFILYEEKIAMSKGPYGRKDRLIKERRHDAYQAGSKWSEPTLCSGCGALFVNGRWSWQEPPEETNEATCPACRRVADHYPAGYIEIKGAFFEEHRDEILNLICNIEKQEKDARPLERIMSITDEKGHTLVKTTGIHIARRIGEALSRSCKGELSFQYADTDECIRVYWQR